MSKLTKSQQKKIKFNDDELEKIVNYICDEENNIAEDENVEHINTEIYGELGIVAEIFNYNFNLNEMMQTYDDHVPCNIVLEDLFKRIITQLLVLAKETLKRKKMFRIFSTKSLTHEFTTVTVTADDMTVDQIYELLNDHLQSNDSILFDG